MGLYHHQAAFLELLFTAAEPLNGSIISNRLNISLKTLKKEIDLLEEVCLEHGCSIQSKAGDGYFLQISDEKAYRPFMEDVQRRVSRSLYYRNEQSERTHYIIRLFLSHGQFLVDDLAEKCYCSSSTINRDLRKVRERLDDTYHLQLIKDRNSGLSVFGSEWLIRMALLNEYRMYNEFDQVILFDEEKINEIFMHNGVYVDMMKERIESVTQSLGYGIPYYAYEDLSLFCIMMITRKKYAALLEESLPWFSEEDLKEEEKVAEELFEDIPGLGWIEISEAERKALAVFLRAKRVIRYHQTFMNLPRREEIMSLADGYIRSLQKKLSLEGVATEQLRRDLCCELWRLQWKSHYHIHTPRYSVIGFSRDGVFTSDFCSDFYNYLKGHMQDRIENSDIYQFYYIFGDFVRKIRETDRKRVLVISGHGFYASRSMANNLGAKTTGHIFEYRPLDYSELSEVNMSEVDAVFTDIDSLKDELNYKPVFDLRYFRLSSMVNTLLQQITDSSYSYSDASFHEDDICYLESVSSLEDIMHYIGENIICSESEKAQFYADMEEKLQFDNLVRAYYYLVFSGWNDYLGETKIKMLFLRKPFEYGHDSISKIIFYNAKDKEPRTIGFIGRKVAALLRQNDLTSVWDKKKDAEEIRKILKN